MWYNWPKMFASGSSEITRRLQAECLETADSISFSFSSSFKTNRVFSLWNSTWPAVQHPALDVNLGNLELQQFKWFVSRRMLRCVPYGLKTLVAAPTGSLPNQVRCVFFILTTANLKKEKHREERKSSFQMRFLPFLPFLRVRNYQLFRFCCCLKMWIVCRRRICKSEVWAKGFICKQLRQTFHKCEVWGKGFICKQPSAHISQMWSLRQRIHL